ncbi:Cytochrome c oxidase subunit 5A, mitochondrial, partial [Fragariocoptes setiger]
MLSNIIRSGARIAVFASRTTGLPSRIGQEYPGVRVTTNQIRAKVYLPNPGAMYPKEGVEETDEEFDARFEAYFNRPDIDGWEIRKGINELHGYDLVPEPKIIIAALKACRRVNDHSLAVRYLEAIKKKCSNDKEIYPYILSEIKPTIDELGISTPEMLGYSEPELALGDPYRCSMLDK